MRVMEIMDRGVPQVKSSTRAVRAAILMDLKEVGVLPVTDEDRVVGLVTDRDFAIHSDAVGMDPERCTVGEIMSKTKVCCFEDDNIASAAKLMKMAKLGFLTVISRKDEHVLGTFSVSDIAKGYDKTVAGEIIATLPYGSWKVDGRFIEGARLQSD